MESHLERNRQTTPTSYYYSPNLFFASPMFLFFSAVYVFFPFDGASPHLLSLQFTLCLILLLRLVENSLLSQLHRLISQQLLHLGLFFPNDGQFQLQLLHLPVCSVQFPLHGSALVCQSTVGQHSLLNLRVGGFGAPVRVRESARRLLP